MMEPLGRGKRQRPTSPEVELLPATASMEVQVSASDANPQQEARFDSGLSFQAIVARSTVSSPPVCPNASFITISESDYEVGKEAQGPTIRFSKALKDKLIQPWKNALIVKLLGAKHTFKYFELKLRQKWALLKSHWSVMDIFDDYYIVRFESEADRNYVLTEGPWIITGRYLVIQKWEPSFTPSVHCIRKLTVWLRISALHVEWFDFNVLTTIGNLLGTLHRVDMRSVTFSRGQYARLCVEIDITKPLERSIKVDDIWYIIQYEALNMVCFNCGIFGHDTDKCPTTNRMDNVAPVISNPATNDENAGVGHSENTVPSLNPEVAMHFSAQNIVQPSGVRGPATTPTKPSTARVVNRNDASQWQQVPNRRSRRQPQPQATTTPTQNASGSRFQILSEEEHHGDAAAQSSQAKFNTTSLSQPFVSTRNSPLGPGQGRAKTTTKPSAAAKHSRAAKGKAVVATSDTSAVPINPFPIPPVFRYNVADEIPEAAIASHPPLPMPPDERIPETKLLANKSSSNSADHIVADTVAENLATPRKPAGTSKSSPSDKQATIATMARPHIQTNDPSAMHFRLPAATLSTTGPHISASAPDAPSPTATHNEGRFPVPKVFAFNVASVLPAAVIASKPPKPPDPPITDVHSQAEDTTTCPDDKIMTDMGGPA